MHVGYNYYEKISQLQQYMQSHNLHSSYPDRLGKNMVVKYLLQDS